MIITIPSRESLLAQMKEKATYINSDYLTWDFPCEEGKKYEVIIRKFDHNWTREEARTWQKENNYDGDIAAFLVWSLQEDLQGYFVSIPNEDSRLFRGSDGDLYAPSFDRDSDYREFHLCDVRYGWDDYGSLVAFRAIPSEPNTLPLEPLSSVLKFKNQEEKELWKAMKIAGLGFASADIAVKELRERTAKSKKK